ncbi:hypothetical protein CALCODRAFT_497366 [Calocera cornea HHB12733]|uniref:DUF6697 domain-containing protein n=1 Tax=Calocera cornea HHB12733 TaxID=1353952 RepID=A0A165F9Q8_9BASI|nr:hypothetical protein CALCODRAFT_497366 [Calocera cornea HHB12733]
MSGRAARRGVRANGRDQKVERGTESPFVVKLEPELDEKKFVLDEVSVRTRLATISSKPIKIELDDETASKTIPRSFFSARYGGSSQSVFPKIGPAKKELHDIDHVVFMKKDWNPELPSRPGEHGLAFCSHRGIYESMPLFVRKAEHQWQYMGEYRMHQVEPLTAEEWRRQDPEMRNIWLDEGYMKLSWGQRARARHVYRERHGGQEPETNDELAELAAIVKSNAWSKVTRAALEDALNDGTEMIHVCALECVAYRADFQRELISGHEEGSLQVWRTLPANSCRKRRLGKKDEDVNTKDDMNMPRNKRIKTC